VGIPYKIPLGRTLDAVITDYGQRSVTGVEYPFNINKASLRALACLPLVGKKRAARIARSRPFSPFKEMIPVLDDQEVAKILRDYVTF
jgi:radical SAM superfamily enzyme with C-terminal helix-hairpin-helix motif